jgi:hypothetical protein
MASRALEIDPKNSDTSEAIGSAEPKALEGVDERAVAALAYQLWQERGCHIGSDQADWFRAEQELKNQSGLVLTAA